MTVGRIPLPKRILELRGSQLAGKRQEQPEICAAVPAPPPWLSGSALDAFMELGQRLANAGVTTAIDANVLARYSVTWDWWCREAKRFCEAGMKAWVLKKDDDATGGFSAKILPGPKLMRELAGDLLALERELGLSPSARTRIRAAPQDEMIENPEERSVESFLRMG